MPTWLPLDADLVVVTSGLVELALGAALLVLTRHRHRGVAAPRRRPR